jgi:hypothetical protein
MVAKEVFVHFYNFIPITFSQKKKLLRYFIKLSGARAGAGLEIRICGSVWCRS